MICDMCKETCIRYLPYYLKEGFVGERYLEYYILSKYPEDTDKRNLCNRYNFFCYR